MEQFLVLGISTAIHNLSYHLHWLNPIMVFFAQYIVFLAPLLVLVFWVRSDGLYPIAAAVSGAILALVCAELIGHIWYVPRPFVAYHFVPLIHHARDSSFPSTHVACLTAIAAGVWRSSWKLGVFFAIVTVVVGFSRIYVGVHSLTDILGGIVLGIIAGLLMWFVVTGPLRPLINNIDDLVRSWKLRPSA